MVAAPNGRRMMVGCGVLRRGNEFWWPSAHFNRQAIDVLTLSGLDEDHLEDFQDVITKLRVRQIQINPTVGPRELRQMKPDGLGPALGAVVKWMENPKQGPAAPFPDFGDVKVRFFYNRFVRGGSNVLNDLSVATVVEFGTFKMLVGGDVEAAGWRSLLQAPGFAEAVAGTQVLIAAPPARSRLRCRELFDAFGGRPKITIFSDDATEPETQEPTSWFAERCAGIPVQGAAPGVLRRVYMTRSDGSIRMVVKPDGGWRLALFDALTRLAQDAPGMVAPAEGGARRGMR